MSPKPQLKDRIKFTNISENIKYQIRSSQAILQYGIGAMVDFPDQTLMTAAPEYWSDNIIKLYDERLQKALKVSYFGVPASGISYVRFPQWYFCPKCRRFQPITEWFQEYKKANSKMLNRDPYMKVPRCSECKQDLVVARVVTVCSDGHIDDFPWIKWAHYRNSGGSKPVCDKPRLTFSTGTTATAGLEGLIVKCTSCNSKATLQDAFDPTIFDKLDKQNGIINPAIKYISYAA